MSTQIYSNSALDIPNEILAIIINELALDTEDNNKTLATCRLASHALCSLATPLFFSSIQLTDYAERDGVNYCSLLGGRATRFNRILTNGNIATSVHTLTLCCDQKSLEDSTNGTPMSAILHRLSNIRTFALKVNGGGYFSIIPEDFASAVQALCRSPNFTTLSLDNARSFPFTAITACPNLRLRHITEVNYFVFRYLPQQLTFFSLPT